jgi:hypothetical protein
LKRGDVAINKNRGGGAMMKQQIAKYWFEKTKLHVKEEERKLEAKRVFFEEFHFEPERLFFADKKIVAYARFEPEDWKIEGKKVIYIEFEIRERKETGNETEYEFKKYSNTYRWTRFTKKHEIKVEIFTEV